MIATAASLLLAACSTSDDGAADGVATTIIAPSAPSTTDVPTTTSGPTPTAAPTTTIDPAEELAAAVEADFREADRLGREASMDPFDSTKEAAALDRRLGVIKDDLEGLLASYRSSNFAIRANLETPGSVVVETSAQLVAGSSDLVRLGICEINSWILVEVGAGPNGSDAIIDPTVVALRATVFLRKVDGVWKIEGGNQTGRWEGVAECPG